jgi:hypothetical protein
VEETLHWVGGVTLLAWGCSPTKTFLRRGQTAHPPRKRRRCTASAEKYRVFSDSQGPWKLSAGSMEIAVTTASEH